MRLPEDGYVRVAQLIGNAKRGIPAILPIGKTTLWRWIREKKFPAPVRLGKRSVAFRTEDVRDYMRRVDESQSQ